MEANDLVEKLSQLNIEEKINYDDNLNKTGLTYDPIMLDYYCEWDPIYPEKPDRIKAPYERCQFYGLVKKCVEIKGRFATDDEIEIAHTKRVNELMKKSEKMNVDELMQLSKEYDSMYWHKDTDKAARWALGSSIELMESIISGKVQNGFAIIRPPGHHAMHDEPNGYCYFNNAAVAAKLAIKKHGLKRVLILDWDVHHGQGTQRMFYDDPNVLYFSLHRYDFGNFWPNLRESDFDYIGEGKGTGYNINVPLNKTGFRNCDYMAVFYNILLPIAYEFSPDLVIVSSGYDSCIGCFEGRMRVTPSCYAHFINALSTLSNGKLCVLLEGGYCIKSLSEGVALTLRGLLGYPCPRLDTFEQPDPMIVDVINNLKAVLRPYWCCLQKLNDYSSQKLSDYLLKFEEIRKNIKFYTEETKPEEFQLTGFYPLYTDEENKVLEKEIDRLIEVTDLSVPEKRTCICTDDIMMRHENLANHNHPEQPARIKRIMDAIKSSNLYEKCLKLKSRIATIDELKLCHTQEYIDSIKQLKDLTQEELLEKSTNKDSVYYHWDTFECASTAVGCLLNVVDAICNKKASNGVAVIRPPGHHAFENKCSGFCFFNSIGIAAKYAQKNYNKKKILILDWDVHHGNGTQDIFKDDDSVLFISLHRYDEGLFYPLNAESNYSCLGEGKAKGLTINIPWNEKGGDAEYVAAFLSIVMPIAYDFNPDLVLVSSGFDAAIRDPLGNFKITPNGFGQMCKMLMSLANGNIILALEGGYNLTSISDCMTTCVGILLGEPCAAISSTLARETAYETIKKCIEAFKPYWKCFQFSDPLPIVEFEKKFKGRNNNNNSQGTQVEMTYSLRPRKQKTGTPAAETKEPEGAVGGSDLTMKDLAITSNEFHAVVPLSYCPHLEEVKPVPYKSVMRHDNPCKECKSCEENWVCLICYQIYCSRFVKGHMVEHNKESKHSVVLSFSDLSVWCYTCDAYLDNEILNEAKLTAYNHKFGDNRI